MQKVEEDSFNDMNCLYCHLPRLIKCGRLAIWGEYRVKGDTNDIETWKHLHSPFHLLLMLKATNIWRKTSVRLYDSYGWMKSYCLLGIMVYVCKSGKHRRVGLRDVMRLRCPERFPCGRFPVHLHNPASQTSSHSSVHRSKAPCGQAVAHLLNVPCMSGMVITGEVKE